MAEEARERPSGTPAAMSATKTSRPTGRTTWMVPAALAIALGLILVTAMALLPGANARALVAERTHHSFGTVRMQDGLLRASFPLAVPAEVSVTELGTT